MTAPNDDWQKRIENGQGFDPMAAFAAQGPEDQQTTSAYPPPGPVYGAPGTGPGYAPHPQVSAVPGYGYPGVDPTAPYGRDPLTGEPLSDKTKIAAGLLQIFLGGFGAGRFYTGHTGIAIGQIAATWLTCGIGAIWPLIDGIIMLAGNTRDSRGLKLRS